MKLETFNPKNWAAPKGYSNAVIAEGRFLFLAGQIGWDQNQVIQSEDLVEQVRQTLYNIAQILKESGSEPKHLVRLTWFVKDKAEYLRNSKRIGEVYREVIGLHYPAMSLVQVADLLEDRAKVEIEATALLP